MDMEAQKEYLFCQLDNFQIIEINQFGEKIIGNDILHNSDNFEDNIWIYISGSLLNMGKKMDKINPEDYYILNSFDKGILFYKKGIEDDSLEINIIKSIPFDSFLPSL